MTAAEKRAALIKAGKLKVLGREETLAVLRRLTRLRRYAPEAVCLAVAVACFAAYWRIA